MPGRLLLAPRLQRLGTRRMAASLFTCPFAGRKVQHWLDDDEDASETEYEAITCKACGRLHLINRKSGRLLGKEERAD